MDRTQNHRDIFGLVQALSQKWQYYGDLQLKGQGITSRQWLLLAALETFETPPGLGELAAVFGSSRQNVKQLLNALEKSGFIRTFRAADDGRALRIQPTEFSRQFWDARKDSDIMYLQELFGPVDDGLSEACLQTLRTLYNRVDTLLTGKEKI